LFKDVSLVMPLMRRLMGLMVEGIAMQGDGGMGEGLALSLSVEMGVWVREVVAREGVCGRRE
jgi:hypothetical protein